MWAFTPSYSMLSCKWRMRSLEIKAEEKADMMKTTRGNVLRSAVQLFKTSKMRALGEKLEVKFENCDFMYVSANSPTY